MKRHNKAVRDKIYIHQSVLAGTDEKMNNVIRYVLDSVDKYPHQVGKSDYADLNDPCQQIVKQKATKKFF